MQRLPKVLTREPLVDAVFEVRLKDTVSLADLLPGILFNALEPKPVIRRLPAAEIPQPLRSSDPNLQFAPLLRLEWDQYFIAIGDQNFVVGCQLPYPKWPNFKKTILYIVEIVDRAGVAGKVERYSMKYVNLIEAPTLAEQIEKIKMSISLGPVTVQADNVNLQVHRQHGDIIHILSVVIGATGRLPDGRNLSGAIVDIDSIRNIQPSDFTSFAGSLGSEVEQLRRENKEMFFGCLKDETIKEMGPIYD